MTRALRNWGVAILAAIVVAISVIMLERERSGVQISDFMIGTTPATLYRMADSKGPMIIVAHGFAGSRQLMNTYSLTLARSGYAVLAFDFEGHGRNPVPMSGDVTRIDGTTARLVAETRAVIAAARALPEGAAGMALLGHSMATDIIVRAAIAEDEAGRPIDTVVAISLFSQAVTANAPTRLLIISGEWEGLLRGFALDALRLVKPDANEGETVQANGIVRRVIVAPNVEHVGVLFSATAVTAARDWLDGTFGRISEGPILKPGLWISALLGGIITLLWPLISLLPKTSRPPVTLSTRQFLIAVGLPALLVPLVATTMYSEFLPVLVADYFLVHLALFGVLQLVMLRVWRWPLAAPSIWPILLLFVWGIIVFGVALDRYAASFLPTPQRLLIIAALCAGTVPFMVADSYVTGSGQGALWRRCLARLAVFLSLGAAAALDPERLLFVLVILPLFLLFFLVHGLMGRWVAQQCGALSAGIGLGFCLAWALGVSFPLFSPG
jgi:pimeloyl-ACP methyl ester carboxylesterase